MFHIVLVEPEIPQNTGNISRTCAVTGAALHLVHPLGFSIDDRQLKRAGLDYWKDLTLFEHDSFEDVERMFNAQVAQLVEKRQAARNARDWATADAVRDQLTAMGYSVEDTPQGPKVKKLL